MNIGAILLIVIGIALIVMGWQGSYAVVWNFLTGQSSGAGPGQGQQPPHSHSTLSHGGQHVA